MRPMLPLAAALALAGCANHPQPLPPQTVLADRLIIPRLCRATEQDWRDATEAAAEAPEQEIRLLAQIHFQRALANCIARSLRAA